MEQKQPIVSKKFFKIVRVLYFMLRKGISKVKLLADLNFMMHRAKIVGKLSSIHNLMFHNHHHSSSATTNNTVSLKEYEFSSKNNRSPSYEEMLYTVALEFAANSVTASPALPGFGRTPVVRQLRISDSPFPLKDIEEDKHIDEAAEEFIKRFHRDLRQQNANASC